MPKALHRYAVLLTHELPSRGHRLRLQAEALYVEAPNKQTVQTYLVEKYPGWSLQRLDRATGS